MVSLQIKRKGSLPPDRSRTARRLREATKRIFNEFLTHFLLLTTATYALVNANAKCRMQSDAVCFDLGIIQCKKVPAAFLPKGRWLTDADWSQDCGRHQGVW